MSDDQNASTGAGATPPPPPEGSAPPPPPPTTFSTPPPPVPQAPPPPPAATYAPAPPAEPPVATATATAAPPPPKKSRKTLWIVLAVVAVVLLCCCAAVAGFVLYAGGEAQKVEETLKATDTHYAAAKAALDPASEAIAQLDSGSSSSEVANVAGEVESSIAEGEKELKEAEKAIIALPADSPVRVNYLQAIEEAQKRPELLREIISTLNGSSQFNEMLKAGVDLNTEGKAQLEQATKWNNRGVKSRSDADYNKAMTYANRAALAFKNSREKLRKAHQLDPSAGVDKLFTYVDLEQRLAVLSHELARYGKAGSVSNYNRTVKRYNSTRNQFNALDEPQLFAGDYYNTLLQDFQEKLQAASDRADEYREKAHAAAKASSSSSSGGVGDD